MSRSKQIQYKDVRRSLCGVALKRKEAPDAHNASFKKNAYVYGPRIVPGYIVIMRIYMEKDYYFG